MKKKVLVYIIMSAFIFLAPLNANMNIDFKKLTSECLANIAQVKSSAKKFPVGKIIKVSEDDKYLLDNPHYTGNHYLVKGDVVGNLSDRVVYKGEVYCYVESQLSAMNPIMTDGKCKELLPFHFSFIPDYYNVISIPTNAILEYDAKNKTLKVLPQDDKLVKELLKIIEKKKNNSK